MTAIEEDNGLMCRQSARRELTLELFELAISTTPRLGYFDLPAISATSTHTNHDSMPPGEGRSGVPHDVLLR